MSREEAEEDCQPRVEQNTRQKEPAEGRGTDACCAVAFKDEPALSTRVYGVYIELPDNSSGWDSDTSRSSVADRERRSPLGPMICPTCEKHKASSNHGVAAMSECPLLLASGCNECRGHRMLKGDASFVKSTFEPSVHRKNKAVCTEIAFGCNARRTRVSWRRQPCTATTQ